MNDGGQGGGGPSQGGAPGQGQGGNQGFSQGQPGGGQQQTAQRARVGEFNGFSAGIMPQQSGQPLLGQDGIPGQQIAVQDRGLMGEQVLDPNDPFFAGQDAQAQALATVDDPFAPVDPDAQQRQQQDDAIRAEVMTAQEVKAAYEQFIQWRDADDLADPLMEKFVTAQVDGQRYRIPVREAVKGYQLHSDYSNKLRELYQYKQNLEQREAGLQKMLNDMDDGQKFLDLMVFLNKFKGFSQAAIIYGTQLDAERRMTPEQRQVHQQMRAQRAYLQKLELENRQLQARMAPQQRPQQQGPTNEQVYQVYMQQLAHIVPRVQQKLGFVASPYAQAEFERHFNQMLPTIVGQDLTSEFVERVMRASMESVDAQLRASGYAPPPRPNAPPAPQQQQNFQRQSNGQFAGQPQQQGRRQLPPAGQLPGPGTPAQQQRPQRARIGDFDRGVRGARQF